MNIFVSISRHSQFQFFKLISVVCWPTLLILGDVHSDVAMVTSLEGEKGCSRGGAKNVGPEG